MVEVLMLEERETRFSNYPKLKGDLNEALIRNSVIVVGRPKDLVRVAREAKESFWYRLFLCHPGCPEEVVETLAKLADAWEVYYSIRFSKPAGRVSRREALQAILKQSIKGRLVALPENTFRCASPLCNQCKLVCPTGAIKLKDGRVSVDPDKCVSCGLCVAVCPLYSLDMPGLAPNEILAAIPPSKASLAKRVVLKPPEKVTEDDFDDQTLVLLSIPLRVGIIVDYFTKVLGWELCDAKGCVPPSAREPRPCELSLPDDLSPLLVVKAAYSLDPKYEVVVNPKLCDACTVCSEVCPTGALKLRSPTMTLSILSHLPAACVGCNACVRACPVQQKLDALGLGIKMIKVVEKDDVECNWKDLVIKKAFKPQCAVCGKELRIDPELYIEKIEELLIGKIKSGELDEVYTPEGFLERIEDALKIMLCEDCFKKYKKKELPAITVARMVLLTLGCVFEQEGVRRGWVDPVRTLWKLSAQLGIQGLSYCSELKVYRGLFV